MAIRVHTCVAYFLGGGGGIQAPQTKRSAWGDEKTLPYFSQGGRGRGGGISKQPFGRSPVCSKSWVGERGEIWKRVGEGEAEEEEVGQITRSRFSAVAFVYITGLRKPDQTDKLWSSARTVKLSLKVQCSLACFFLPCITVCSFQNTTGTPTTLEMICRFFVWWGLECVHRASVCST